ncbi:unnamed protein product, partial [Effrenium voratum]
AGDVLKFAKRSSTPVLPSPKKKAKKGEAGPGAAWHLELQTVVKIHADGARKPTVWDLKKLRQDKCNELMADAMRPPDDDGAEQPPRRKKAKLAQPRRYANLLPEVIELAVPEVNSDTPGRVMRLLTENIGEQKFWIELTGPNLEYVKSAVLAATPGKKKSSTQNDPAEHQPLQMPSPE